MPEANARAIERAWEAYGKTRPNSIGWAIHNAFFWQIWYGAFLKACSVALTLSVPQLLHMLLHFIEEPTSHGRSGNDPSEAIWLGYAAAAGMVLVQLFQTQVATQYSFHMARTGMRLRGGLSVLIFEKSLRLSQPAATAIGIGNIVNLMESDCMKLSYSFYSVHNLWSLPVMLVVGIIMLYQQVQWAAFCAFGVMLLLFLPNSYFMAKAWALISVSLKIKDKRVKLLTEYLQGIRIIKLLGLERALHGKVAARRKEEVDVIFVQRLYWTIISMLAQSTPLLIDVSTLSIYVVATGEAFDCGRGVHCAHSDWHHSTPCVGVRPHCAGRAGLWRIAKTPVQIHDGC